MAVEKEWQSIATRTDSSEQTSDESYITSKLRMVRLIMVQSSLGQKLLSFADKFLWTVEKCAEWSLPAEKIVGEDGKTVPKPKYVRPLPWYLFLPSLLIMRMIRMTLNIGARMMGYSNITPNKIVNLMQSSRRSVHAVKINGLKTRQEQVSKDKRLSMHEARKALIRTIRLTLSTLSCLDASKPSLSPPPTKIHINSAFVLDSTSPSSQSSTLKSSPISDSTYKETSISTQSSSESEESIQQTTETLEQMIDRLAKESSSNDEDFNPDDEDMNDEDDSDDTDDDNSVDDNISMVELTSIIEEANELFDIKSTSDQPNQADQIKQDFNQEVNQTSEEKAKNISEDKVEQSSQEATTKQDSTDDLEQTTPTEKRLSSEESRAKVDDRLTSSRSHDSLECYMPDRSSQEGDLTFYSPISSDSDTPKEHSATTAADKIVKTNQFINGEVRFVSEAMISEPKSTRRTNNGAVVEKRSTNVSKIHRGKRTSHGNRKKK